MRSEKTKRITYIAILSAAYVVLSALIKIPVAGHITLDMGYIAFMVAIVFLGPAGGAVVGALGAGLESIMFASNGFAPGWVVMNLIVGLVCGMVLQKVSFENRKSFIIAAVFSVVISMAVGVTAKTFIDCAMYDIPLLAKIPTGITAWILDSAVMLAIGLPLSLALKKRLGKTL